MRVLALKGLGLIDQNPVLEALVEKKALPNSHICPCMSDSQDV